MKVIGITGGVGAGKSAILDYIEANYNARVLKADEIAHDLMEPGTDCYQALREQLPKEAFGPEGRLDRKTFAALLFSGDNLREKINSIVHPAVKVYIIDTISKEREIGTLDYLVIEAALLIEDHYEEICDELWYIYASKENRRQRLMESRGYSEEKIRQIFASQLDEEEYRRHCRVVIDNNKTIEDAFQKIAQALKESGAEG